MYLLADEVLAAVYPASSDGPHAALMRCFQKVLSKSDAAQLPHPAMPKRCEARVPLGRAGACVCTAARRFRPSFSGVVVTSCQVSSGSPGAMLTSACWNVQPPVEGGVQCPPSECPPDASPSRSVNCCNIALRHGVELLHNLVEASSDLFRYP